jgi:C-terminal processing protease CtpA/Prc
MKRCFLFFAILFLSIQLNYSQEKHELKLNNDDTFRIPEVGAYIIRDKDNFKVQFVAPESVRLPAYKNVDLKKDDILMMVNGKAVKNLNDLKETYEKLKPGHDFKLEVKRGAKMILVNIKKADPKDLPQRKNVKLDDKRMENKVLLEGYGILIGKINEKPMIEKLFHEDNELVKKAGLQGGDLLTNINGQAIKTFNQFKIAYEIITPGQEVRIKFGDKYISFKKK